LYLSDFKNKIIKEIDELIKKGNSLYKINFIDFSRPPQKEDRITFNSWVIEANKTFESVLGSKFDEFKLEGLEKNPSLIDYKNNYRDYLHDIIENNLIKLNSFKQVIEKGLISNLELEAYKIYSSDLLRQMEYFYKKGYYLASTIIGRVLIEQSLKTLLKKNKIDFDDDDRGGMLNQKLYDDKIYPVTVYHEINSLYAIGSDATHNRNLPPNPKKSVKRYINDIKDTVLALL